MRWRPRLSRARDQHAASAVGRRRRSRSPAAQRDGLDVGDRRLRARRGPFVARANRAPASRGEARGADARAVAMPGRPRRGRVEPRAPRAGADRHARARRSAVRGWRGARRGGGGRPQDGCPLRDRSRGLSRRRASRLAGGDALARPRAADRARRPSGSGVRHGEQPGHRGGVCRPVRGESDRRPQHVSASLEAPRPPSSPGPAPAAVLVQSDDRSRARARGRGLRDGARGGAGRAPPPRAGDRRIRRALAPSRRARRPAPPDRSRTSLPHPTRWSTSAPTTMSDSRSSGDPS